MSADFLSRRVIALGDRDGVPGHAIAACALAAGARVELIASTYFVCCAAGAMDFEHQGRILHAARRYGPEELIVLLGQVDPIGVTVFANTVREGDPALAGPLNRTPLYLPVMHVFDPEFRRHVPPAIWNREIGPFESLVEIDPLVQAAREAMGQDSGAFLPQETLFMGCGCGCEDGRVYFD